MKVKSYEKKILYQFELSTYCNLSCFYCPIEALKNIHMSFEKFCSLIDEIESPATLKLQGTGEAMLHPEFDKFILYAKEKGHRTNIITNGAINISDAKLKNLDRIGFSIDTLDEKLAREHGRKNLDKVILNLLNTHKKAPEKCMIFSVCYGQDLRPLQIFAKNYNIHHVIQNIQTKTSYQTKYKTNKFAYNKYECSFVNEDKMNYYFADGTLAPCCYMIDVKDVLSKNEIKGLFEKSIVPKCCGQCGELTGKKRLF